MRVISALLLTACAVDPDLGDTTQSISGSGAQLATQFQRDRAFDREGGCTATRIGPRHAISAVHCQPSAGNVLHAYAGGPGSEPGNVDVAEVILRPGVDMAACADHGDNCGDANGWLADVALLRLTAQNEDDLEGPSAVIAWTYPGSGVLGVKVGSGAHESQPNPDGILLQTSDFTLTANADDGEFYTAIHNTNKGDSGGPIYVGNRVFGTLWGSRDGNNRYTSTTRHLHWLLTNIGWRWRGQPPQTATHYTGTLLETFDGSELECQYACENTGACEAYSLYGATCRLYDNPTAINASSQYRGAFKHGARSANSGTTVGYLRNGVSAVVNVSSDGRIDELALTSTGWSATDIHGNAPPVLGKISAYRRSDGVNTIVYRSNTNRLIELALVGNTWTWADLTAVTNAEPPNGSPVGYVRADGVSAIVYRGSLTNHIIELRLGSTAWLASDLTAAAGASVTSSSEPSVSVRPDGVNSITFRSGNHIWELYQAPGGLWVWGVPSQLAASAPLAAGRPFGYAHRDGTIAIVYRSTTNQIIELYNLGGQWHWGQIGSGASGDPTAYVRTDGVDAVVFTSTDGQLTELTNYNGWVSWNLTAVTGGPAVSSSPTIYHRADGYNVVLAKTSSNHVIEHVYKRGGTWKDYDLTVVTGETP